jgi:hypothetical protein
MDPVGSGQGPMTGPCKHCDELSGPGSTYLVGWLDNWCMQWHSEMQLEPKLMFRIVFWDVLPCKMVVDRRTSETSFDNHFTRQYIPEDNSELHTLRLLLIEEAARTSETSVYNNFIQQYIP